MKSNYILLQHNNKLAIIAKLPKIFPTRIPHTIVKLTKAKNWQ